MTRLIEGERQIRAVLLHGEGELWTRPECSNDSGNLEAKADLKQTRSKNAFDDEATPMLVNDQETSTKATKTRRKWNREKDRQPKGVSKNGIKDNDKGEKVVIVGVRASNQSLKKKGSHGHSNQKNKELPCQDNRKQP
jgi:hypothetical protein